MNKKTLGIITLTALLTLLSSDKTDDPKISKQKTTDPVAVYSSARTSYSHDSLLVNNNVTIESLIVYFRNRGFEIGEFFSRPEFKVHKNISSIFKNSPEAKALRTYKEALKKGDPEMAEKIFDSEYEKYKEKVGFEGKSKKIKPFIKDNLEQLLSAEEKYYIPKEIIAAVLGVESDFGRNKGKYYAFNAYVSLYLSGYKREFALEQLEELLNFCKRTNKDVFIKSSYAGAIGYSQFLPSSLNKLFIGNNVYDINSNILSIANYLAYFMKEKKDIEKALLDYNLSMFYAKSVLELAEHGKEKKK